MALIRRWNAGDEFAPVVSDSDGDWWGGAFQCAVSIVLASALSASALTAQIANTHYDDPTSASCPPEESEFLPPPQVVPLPPLAAWAWDAQNDLPLLTIDEQDDRPSFARGAPPPPLVVAWDDASDYAAPAPATIVEDDGYLPRVALAIPPRLVALWEYGAAEEYRRQEWASITGRFRTGPALDALAFTAPAVDGRGRTAPALDAAVHIEPG